METLLNDFSPGLFVMQAVILLILILLMRKFAWKPILKALDEREEGIDNAIKTAEAARKEIESLKSSNDNLLKEARAERDLIIREAKELAVKMVEESKTTAKVEADKIMESSRKAIIAEKTAAISDIKAQIADFSIQIAEKLVVGELASDEKQKALSEKLASDFNLN